MSDDPSQWTMSKPLAPSAFRFVAQGRMFLTITTDGRIEIGEGFEPDEAGRKAIEGMQYQLAFIIEAAVAAERERCAKIVADVVRDDSPTMVDGNDAEVEEELWFNETLRDIENAIRNPVE